MVSPTKEIQKAAHSITGSSNSTGADKSKTSGRLFFLDAGGGRVFSANADGSDLKTIISEGRKFPDGLVVDAAAGHIYWTNMGNPVVNDGSIERATGLRWGVMGPTLQWHLGGGANGIQHFLDHLMDPLAGLMKALGTPDVTPELKKTIAEGVSQMAGDHSVEQLAKEENKLLVDLIKLRAQQARVLAAEAHA